MRWGAKSVGHICCFLDQSKILVAQTEIDRYVREVGFCYPTGFITHTLTVYSIMNIVDRQGVISTAQWIGTRSCNRRRLLGQNDSIPRLKSPG